MKHIFREHAGPGPQGHRPRGSVVLSSRSGPADRPAVPAGGRVRWMGRLVVLLFAAGGCQPQVNRFRINDYQADGQLRQYMQEFEECYYALDRSGNIDVVARRCARGPESGEDIVQVLHIRTMYRAVPGETAMDPSMINGLVCYAIVGDSGGACYEGGGFLSCTEDRRRQMVSGRLEQSKLHANRRAGEPVDLFERAEVIGEFKARRDEARVTDILNELSRLFGPQPQYQPPPPRPDLM